jgi:hypothetical protein
VTLCVVEDVKLNLCILYVEVGSCENKDGGKDELVIMCKVYLIDHTSSPTCVSLTELAVVSLWTAWGRRNAMK